MNPLVAEIIHDGGMKSLKLRFSVFAIMIIFTGGLMAAHWPTLQPMYSTMVGGVLGIAGMYLTGHVAQKMVGVQAMKASGSDDSEADPAADKK